MTNVRMRRFFLLVGFLCLSAVVNAAWQDTNSGLWFEWIDKNVKEDGVKVIQAQNGSYSGPYTIPVSIPSPEDENESVPVKQIAQQAFINASGLTDVVIEADIWQIDNETFRNSGLKSIVIPSSVTRIATSAFANTKLTAITIPESVTEISGNAFGYCTQLQSVTFANVQALCNITFEEINSNPLYYAKQLYFAGAPTTPVTNLTIPVEVKTIKKYAFYNCESLTSLTLEEGIERIEESTFAYCTNLGSVIIPSSLTSIGYNAFNGDSKIYMVRFSATNEEEAILSLCSKTYGNIYANPLYYAHEIFIRNNENPTSVVTIPEESLENGNRVRPYILAGALSLEKVTLPKEATVIGYSAFNGCIGLKYAEYADQDQLLDMEYENTEANPLNYAKELLINGSYPTSITFTKNVKPRALINAQWLEVVDIKEGVTSIGAGAFMNCKKLAMISIPSTLTTGAFKLCSELITVSQMPANMTTIPDNCFENCYQLKSITIPNTVTTIGNSAFRNCVALTNIPYGETSAITEIGENK